MKPAITEPHVYFFKNLDAEELANPTKVIEDFFSTSWLPSHLRHLKTWRNDLLPSNEPRKSKASNLLYNHELIIKLLEAAWVLKDRNLGKIKINKADTDKIGKWYVKGERKKNEHYPKNLTIREMVNPRKVLRKTFNRFNIDQYVTILKQWLYDAFCEKYMEESLEKVEVILVYENLVRLFEAMWLIQIRSEQHHRDCTCPQ